MPLIERADGFDLVIGGVTLLRHRRDEPCAYLGAGEPDVRMTHGHFRIEDYLVSRVPLVDAQVTSRAGGAQIVLAAAGSAGPKLVLGVDESDRHLVLSWHCETTGVNRCWLRVAASANERVWGGGEQLSYFDLRGRRFPLWTSEPGVGRDKSTRITFESDRHNGAGGDYYTTNYPQPTYLSSSRYALHVETTAFAAFDFRHADFHEIEVWEVPARIEVWHAPHFRDLVETLSARFGRQPRLPARSSA
jgi:alpha-glucosidase